MAVLARLVVAILGDDSDYRRTMRGVVEQEQAAQEATQELDQARAEQAETNEQLAQTNIELVPTIEQTAVATQEANETIAESGPAARQMFEGLNMDLVAFATEATIAWENFKEGATVAVQTLNDVVDSGTALYDATQGVTEHATALFQTGESFEFYTQNLSGLLENFKQLTPQLAAIRQEMEAIQAGQPEGAPPVGLGPRGAATIAMGVGREIAPYLEEASPERLAELEAQPTIWEQWGGFGRGAPAEISTTDETAEQQREETNALLREMATREPGQELTL